MAHRVIPGGRRLFEPEPERAKRLESGTMPLQRASEPDLATSVAPGHGSLSVRGEWLGADAALCEILGRDARELCATTLLALTHPDDADEDLSQLERIRRGDAEASTSGEAGPTRSTPQEERAPRSRADLFVSLMATASS